MKKSKPGALCSAAGVATADLLPAREESAARKREAQTHLSTLRNQLAQASARPEEELRKSLAGQDAVAIESERDRSRLEIGQREAVHVVRVLQRALA